MARLRWSLRIELGDADSASGILRDSAWQGAGRFDIPKFAVTLYAAESPNAAVGETFASQSVWTDAMLWSGYSHRRRCLVEYEHTGTIVELDDARFLASRGDRPSDIVARNRARSQEIALELWLDGVRALRWWSYHRPEWKVRSMWAPVDDPTPWDDVEVIAVTELTIEHPAVVVAAETLRRQRA